MAFANARSHPKDTVRWLLSASPPPVCVKARAFLRVPCVSWKLNRLPLTLCCRRSRWNKPCRGKSCRMTGRRAQSRRDCVHANAHTHTHTRNVAVECTVHAHTLLGKKNVMEERVNLFSPRQVGVSSHFHPLGKSRVQSCGGLWGGILLCVHVCV